MNAVVRPKQVIYWPDFFCYLAVERCTISFSAYKIY